VGLARRGGWPAGAPRRRVADGDRLPGRAGAVLAVADPVDLLAHELACLGGGRLAGTLVLAGLLDCLLPGHRASPYLLASPFCLGGDARDGSPRWIRCACCPSGQPAGHQIDPGMKPYVTFRTQPARSHRARARAAAATGRAPRSRADRRTPPCRSPSAPPGCG